MDKEENEDLVTSYEYALVIIHHLEDKVKELESKLIELESQLDYANGHHLHSHYDDYDFEEAQQELSEMAKLEAEMDEGERAE
tara:strand:+ start:475 stop:723 length:249 start_codon:yes stop_codon:yes gene_type:complete